MTFYKLKKIWKAAALYTVLGEFSWAQAAAQPIEKMKKANLIKEVPSVITPGDQA